MKWVAKEIRFYIALAICIPVLILSILGRFLRGHDRIFYKLNRWVDQQFWG